MSFFCLFWVPLFYLLRKAVVGAGASSGGIWALLLGSVVSITQFLLGNFVSPGGFGFSRWVFGFVDIVCVPVLVPLFIYLFIFIFRIIFRKSSGKTGFAGFTLLWLVPWGAMRALTWSALNDPILLIAVPVLWTSIAAGISFFINWMITGFKWYSAIVSILCIPAMPLIAATTYWALFSQQTLIGLALLFVMHIPIAFSFIFERHKN